MEIITDLNNCSKKQHWLAGLMWLSYAILFALFPVWAGLLLLFLFGQRMSLEAFTNNGEFALYSASFISGAIYIITKDFKKRSFPSMAILILILIGAMLFATVMYTSIALSELMAAHGFLDLLKLLNREVVVIISWVVLPLVLFISFLVFVAESVRVDPDIVGARAKNIEALSKEFDELGGDDDV